MLAFCKKTAAAGAVAIFMRVLCNYIFPCCTCPVAPAGPVFPVAPVAPVAPAGPVGPTAPAGPVIPVAPVAPATWSAYIILSINIAPPEWQHGRQ